MSLDILSFEQRFQSVKMQRPPLERKNPLLSSSLNKDLASLSEKEKRFLNKQYNEYIRSRVSDEDILRYGNQVESETVPFEDLSKDMVNGLAKDLTEASKSTSGLIDKETVSIRILLFCIPYHDSVFLVFASDEDILKGS